MVYVKISLEPVLMYNNLHPLLKIRTLFVLQGLILAIDRNKNKIPIMKTDCISKSINCVRCFAYDSTKLLDRNEIPLNQSISDGPPFKPHSFDRILLDSTCSGFGQRPLLYTLIESTRRLSSYPVVQRQLFHEVRYMFIINDLNII